MPPIHGGTGGPGLQNTDTVVLSEVAGPEHPASTGIGVTAGTVFTGIRGMQPAGRASLIDRGILPARADGREPTDIDSEVGLPLVGTVPGGLAAQFRHRVQQRQEDRVRRRCRSLRSALRTSSGAGGWRQHRGDPAVRSSGRAVVHRGGAVRRRRLPAPRAPGGCRCRRCELVVEVAAAGQPVGQTARAGRFLGESALRWGAYTVGGVDGGKELVDHCAGNDLGPGRGGRRTPVRRTWPRWPGPEGGTTWGAFR